MANISFDQIRTDRKYDIFHLYEDFNNEDDINSISDSPFTHGSMDCEYMDPSDLSKKLSIAPGATSCFHINCRGLSHHWEGFKDLISELHSEQFTFDVIGISEAFQCENDTRLKLPGYQNFISRCREQGNRGGVGLFIKDSINYKIREYISVFIPYVFESLFIEIESHLNKNIIIGVIYRPNSAPRARIDIFSTTLFDIMDIINNEDKLGTIMGDMNVDLLKFQNHQKTSDYLDKIFSNGFLPAILEPTRISSFSATLIDHIYTNNVSSFSSGIIVTDLADHFGTYLSTNTKIKHKITHAKQTRIFSDTNINLFNDLLKNTDFSCITELRCPNLAYEEFISLYKSAFEQAFPLKTIRPNKKFTKREAWVTQGLLTSSRNKVKLLNKKLVNPTEQNLTRYKIYNNIYNKLRRQLKINYYTYLLEENKFNIKKTWASLNKAIGREKDKAKFPDIFQINNQHETDKTKIAEGFNKYFSDIGLTTSQNVAVSPHNFTHYLPNAVPHSMYIEPVTPSMVLNVTLKLKSKLSCGHDEISYKLLKQTIINIIIPLTHIINISF